MSPLALARGLDARAWQRDLEWARREWVRLTLARLEFALLLDCDPDTIPEAER